MLNTQPATYNDHHWDPNGAPSLEGQLAPWRNVDHIGPIHGKRATRSLRVGLPASASTTAHPNLPSRRALRLSCAKSSRHTACSCQLLPGHPPLQEPLCQGHALPPAACSGQRCTYENHPSPTWDNFDKPSSRGPPQLDFHLCSVLSPHSSCLWNVSTAAPPAESPAWSMHRHSQGAGLFSHSLTILCCWCLVQVVSDSLQPHGP